MSTNNSGATSVSFLPFARLACVSFWDTAPTDGAATPDTEVDSWDRAEFYLQDLVSRHVADGYGSISLVGFSFDDLPFDTVAEAVVLRLHLSVSADGECSFAGKPVPNLSTALALAIQLCLTDGRSPRHLYESAKIIAEFANLPSVDLSVLRS